MQRPSAGGACARRLARRRREDDRRDDGRWEREMDGEQQRREGESKERQKWEQARKEQQSRKGERREHNASLSRREEVEARQAAACQHNREAAAAVFERAKQAWEEGDAMLALRRVERCMQLHAMRDPSASPPLDPVDRTALSYREWYAGLLKMIEGGDDSEEGASEFEEEEGWLWGGGGGRESHSHTIRKGRRESRWGGSLSEEEARRLARQIELEKLWDSTEARRNEKWGVGARQKEEILREETRRREKEMKRQERVRQEMELEESRKRQEESHERAVMARRAHEEERARAEAVRAANAEAAGRFAAKAAAARAEGRHADAARLLSKSVSLQPWALKSRWWLGVAMLALHTRQARMVGSNFVTRRGGIRSYLTLAALLLLLFLLTFVTIAYISSKLDAACIRSRIRGLCPHHRSLSSLVDSIRNSPLRIALATALAPALLALVLPAKLYNSIASTPGAFGRWAIYQYHSLAHSGTELFRAARKAFESLCEELLREEEPEPRRARHPRYPGYSSSGWHESAHSQPSTARRGASAEERFAARVRALPPGEARRVLLASTHYQVLGVPSDCTGVHAKKAFHKLALQLHPDKCSQEMSEDAFKRVEQARKHNSNRSLAGRCIHGSHDLQAGS